MSHLPHPVPRGSRAPPRVLASAGVRALTNAMDSSRHSYERPKWGLVALFVGFVALTVISVFTVLLPELEESSDEAATSAEIEQGAMRE